MTTNSSKAPRPPRRTGFGNFATATAPTASTPTPAAADPAPTVDPTPAAAAQPAAAAPPADPAHDAAPPQPAPTSPGGQLAQLFAGDGPDVARAILAGPPVDPMLDLVALGASVPRHYKRALDNAAFHSGRRRQDLVQQALLQFLGPELIEASLPKRS